MLIVFDTNIWRKHLALKSQSGAAVRFFVLRQGATVVVPEVIRLELEEQLGKLLRQRCDEIRKAHQELLTVFGSLKELVLPSDNEIEAFVAGIVPNLDVPVREVPFTLEAAHASFLKTVRKLPPSSEKNQQFKDGAIWAACVALLQEDDVYLITDDSAFYEGRKYANGPARNLAEEADGRPYRLHLVSSLRELLQSIRVDVSIDKSALVSVFLAENDDSINGLLSRTGFALGDTADVEVELFATESSSRLYAEFQIHYSCPDASEQGRANARLDLAGSGFFDGKSGAFLELQNQGESITYVDDEGEKRAQNHFVTGASVIGHRTIERTLKVPLAATDEGDDVSP